VTQAKATSITNSKTSVYSVPPAPLEIAKDKNQLRIEWSPPEEALCDSYRLNYTVLSLSQPKSFDVSSTTNYFVHIKFLTGHKLEVSRLINKIVRPNYFVMTSCFRCNTQIFLTIVKNIKNF
jgi:hypothetical protein